MPEPDEEVEQHLTINNEGRVWFSGYNFGCDGERYKSYYYMTEDDSIEIGDFVLVPAGKDNHKAVVEVVNIEYFSEENVPLPIEKTKRIIRKCTDEDFDQPVE